MIGERNKELMDIYFMIYGVKNMNLSLHLPANFFGTAIEYNKAMKIRNEIYDLFRKSYVKKDMTTHGSLWNQYISPGGIIATCDIHIDKNIQGYVFVEGKKKGMQVFLSTLKQFLDYLESREDGLFPAIYFIDKKFTFCLGENGERGSMKPIYIYKGLRK